MQGLMLGVEGRQVYLKLSLWWLLSCYFNSFIIEELGINYSSFTFIFHCQFSIIFNSTEELQNLHNTLLKVNCHYNFSLLQIMNIILESKQYIFECKMQLLNMLIIHIQSVLLLLLWEK